MAHPRSSAPAKPAVTLTEKEQAAIRMALESKMFTVDQLAKSYSVPASVIRDITSA
jgi:phage portal protein BeeE